MKNPLKDSLVRRLRAATRSRQPPSERNLQLFAEVEVLGRRQVDVAAEQGISQGRVAQICRAVEQWRQHELEPQRQGPEQFRELADLLCELAFLRLVAEEGGEAPRSASRQEIFWHAARTFVAMGPQMQGPNISPAKASTSSAAKDAGEERSVASAPATTHVVPTGFGKATIAAAAANSVAKNVTRSENIRANASAARGSAQAGVQYRDAGVQ